MRYAKKPEPLNAWVWDGKPEEFESFCKNVLKIPKSSYGFQPIHIEDSGEQIHKQLPIIYTSGSFKTLNPNYCYWVTKNKKGEIDVYTHEEFRSKFETYQEDKSLIEKLEACLNHMKAISQYGSVRPEAIARLKEAIFWAQD